MPTLSAVQVAKAADLAVQIEWVMRDVWEAFDTSIMSDAKSAVYQIQKAVTEDTILPEQVKAELLDYVNSAWLAIVGEGTTWHRAQSSHEQLAYAERYVKELIVG